MSNELIEQLAVYENEYREYRTLFESDGVVTANKQTQLDLIADMIRGIRRAQDTQARSASSGGMSTLRCLKADWKDT